MKDEGFLKRFLGVSMVLAFCSASSVHAIDSDLTRRTLGGIRGVNVVIEGLHPNIQKYAQKAGLKREQVKEDVEGILKKAGIAALTYEQWTKTSGRPFLYVVINTHEYEKYWFAYDIKVELIQGVSLETNPSVKTMAGTWSINMTGLTNVGKLNTIKEDVNVLAKKFADACMSEGTKDKMRIRRELFP